MAFGGRVGAGHIRNEINVTPLVDVVLVLLIIFLVAMPVLLRMLDVDVPKKSEVPAEPLAQPIVEITKDGSLLLDGVSIQRSALAARLGAELEHRHDRVVFVDFDGSVKYGEAVHIMDICKGAGATTVALKTGVDRD